MLPRVLFVKIIIRFFDIFPLSSDLLLEHDEDKDRRVLLDYKGSLQKKKKKCNILYIWV